MMRVVDLNPRRTKPPRCPLVPPLVQFCCETQTMHHLVVRDPARTHGLARPSGTTGIEIFRAAGRSRDLPLSEAEFIGTFRRTKIVVEAPRDRTKFKSTYYARWTGKGDEKSPFSLPACL